MLDPDTMRFAPTQRSRLGDAIPENPAVASAILRHIEDGHPTGDFCRNLLANNLKMAIYHADDWSQAALIPLVRWLYNNAPEACWGSEQNRAAWAAAMEGFRAAEEHGEPDVSFRDHHDRATTLVLRDLLVKVEGMVPR